MDFAFRKVTFEEFVVAANIELTYLAINLIILRYHSIKQPIKIRRGFFSLLRNNNPIYRDKIVTYAIVFTLVFQALQISYFSLSYFSSISEQNVFITLLIPIAIITKSILYIYVIFYRNSRLRTYIAVLAIVADVFISLSSGSRMQLIVFLLIPVLIYLAEGNIMSNLKKISIAIFLTITLALTLQLIPIIEDIRGSQQKIHLNELSLNNDNFNGLLLKRFLQSFLIKLSSVQNAAILVKEEGYNNNTSEYIDPFKIIIPRFIWPEKHANFNQTSGKVAARYLGMDESTGVVGVSPAQTTLWSFGYLGIVVSLVFASLYLKILISLIRYNTILSYSFALVFLNFPFLDRIPATYGSVVNLFILQFFSYFLIYVVSLFIIGNPHYQMNLRRHA